jgi:hypothetical protein
MRHFAPLAIVIGTLGVFAVDVPAGAQRGGRGDAQAALTPRAAAPIDLVGQWVSLITEDWRYRQFTPPKGDYGSVPLLPAARKIADSGDPARDEAAGEQCKAYGAAGLLRLPTRVRISWQDDTILKPETDAGTGDLIANLRRHLDCHLADADNRLVMALHGAIHEREQLRNQAGSLVTTRGAPRASPLKSTQNAHHT